MPYVGSAACLWSAGDARWALELLLGHIGQVLGTCLRAQQVQPHKYEKALQLLQCIHGLSSTAGRWALRIVTALVSNLECSHGATASSNLRQLSLHLTAVACTLFTAAPLRIWLLKRVCLCNADAHIAAVEESSAALQGIWWQGWEVYSV